MVALIAYFCTVIIIQVVYNYFGWEFTQLKKVYIIFFHVYNC